jgi:5'(3')-deoxyribonucleotidase
VRIGIDVDGVVADNHTAWLTRFNKLYSTKWTPDDLTQWEMWLDLGCKPEQLFELWTPDIYNDILPYPGALEAVKALAEQGHEIFYITSCAGEPEYEAKVEWLFRHKFRFDGVHTVPVGKAFWYATKEAVAHDRGVDTLIDDHVLHVEAWPGMAYLMTRPHNRRAITPRKRVKSLGDVVALLKHVKPGVSVTFTGNQPNIVELVYASPVVQEAIEARRPQPLLLPTERQERKDIPMCTGVFDYFPAALAEVAKVSKAGNDQHNPGQPLHWARGKSMDHGDALLRHWAERGTLDTDNLRHTAKAAWRALAELQEECERDGAPMSRASKVVD